MHKYLLFFLYFFLITNSYASIIEHAINFYNNSNDTYRFEGLETEGCILESTIPDGALATPLKDGQPSLTLFFLENQKCDVHQTRVVKFNMKNLRTGGVFHITFDSLYTIGMKFHTHNNDTNKWRNSGSNFYISNRVE